MKTKLYYDVLDAFRAEFPSEYPPEIQEYEDVLNLCKACFAAALFSPEESSISDVIEPLLSCKTEYGCWIGVASEAMEKADLSFLDEPEICEIKLLAAHEMASAWLFHLYEVRKTGANKDQ